MPASEEKHASAERLKQALARNSEKIGSAVELALQFNLRATDEPISAQATHKWLVDTAIPTFDKTETLTAWLDISLRWLRFGIPESAGKHRKRKAKTGDVGVSTVCEAELITWFRAMPEARCKFVVDSAERLSLDGEM